MLNTPIPPPSMEPDRIVIRAFRAVEDPLRCESFVREHTKVLEDIGVFNALKPDTSWCTDPNVVVFVAEHPTLGMVAGMRLHVAVAGGSELPMSRSLRTIDPAYAVSLEEAMPDERAEICGLWNAHRYAGHGIPFLLISAGVAIANQIGLKKLACLAAEYVVPYTTRVGFMAMDMIGDNGSFCFPVPSIRSHAMIIHDLATLKVANFSDRHRILSLRLNPAQTRQERLKDHDLTVLYTFQGTDQSDRWAGRRRRAKKAA